MSRHPEQGGRIPHDKLGAVLKEGQQIQPPSIAPKFIKPSRGSAADVRGQEKIDLRQWMQTEVDKALAQLKISSRTQSPGDYIAGEISRRAVPIPGPLGNDVTMVCLYRNNILYFTFNSSKGSRDNLSLDISLNSALERVKAIE